MTKEETRNRLADVENQMTQMAAMIIEMNAFIIAARGSYPTAPNTITPNAGETSRDNQNQNKEPVQEHLPKTTPDMVNLEEDGTSKKTPSRAKDEEEAKMLAKIEKCLASQGYKLQRFNKFSLYAKVVIPKNQKKPEFVSKYKGTGCPKTT